MKPQYNTQGLEHMCNRIYQTFDTYSNEIVIKWKDGSTFKDMSYAELKDVAFAVAASLVATGEKISSHVAVITDTSKEWTFSILGIQLACCVDVPRGTDSTPADLCYILGHSGAKIAFVGNAQVITAIEKESVKSKYKPAVKQYILLDNGKVPKTSSKVITLDSFIAAGKKHLKDAKIAKDLEIRRQKLQLSDTTSIIYTSGTTGEPKGVELTHQNVDYQFQMLDDIIPKFTAKDRVLEILPPWHIFGRTVEIYFFYNSVPVAHTTIKTLGEDLKIIKPTIFPAVPRLWEGLYDKIFTGASNSGKLGLLKFCTTIAVFVWRSGNFLYGKSKKSKKIMPLFLPFMFIFHLSRYLLLYPLKFLAAVVVFKKVKEAVGGKLNFAFSGGSSLPLHLDEFFGSIGIEVWEAYGLTETAPLISGRDYQYNVPGTVGKPVKGTEWKVIDIDGNDITKTVTHNPGSKGTLHVRGIQVMKGYYKEPKKTAAVLSKDGWFNTGDLVAFTTDGNMSIVGRSKDTIVLLGGENIEPTPIEDILKQSLYIDHVMCVGQDKKVLGALIVPNQEALEKKAKENGLGNLSVKDLMKHEVIREIYKREIVTFVSSANGFRNFEKIIYFSILDKPFEKGDELNNTFKLRRHIVTDKYSNVIEELFN